jgi:hypothetical protein
MDAEEQRKKTRAVNKEIKNKEHQQSQKLCFFFKKGIKEINHG